MRGIIETFLLGAIVMASVTTGLFFLKFWKGTRDRLFLAFALFFIIDGLDRITVLFMPRPNEGSPWIYVIRFFTLLVILAAIIQKNYGRNR